MRQLAILLIIMIIFSCSTNSDVDISKYPIILSAKELKEYYDLSLDVSGRFEESNITKYFDGSFELEYTYDLLETERYDPLFYSITIEGEPTLKDAKQIYKIGKGVVNIVANSFSQGSIEIDSLNLPGDESFYSIRTYEGEPNGIFYTMRKGKLIYTLIMTGLYSEDHSIILDLVLPKIENIENFRLKE